MFLNIYNKEKLEKRIDLISTDESFDRLFYSNLTPDGDCEIDIVHFFISYRQWLNRHPDKEKKATELCDLSSEIKAYVEEDEQGFLNLKDTYRVVLSKY